METACRTDYYALLGVPRSASHEEIKAAYRRLAQRLHPDLARAPDAEARFKAVTEAYQVLRDPESRVRYELQAMERELEERRREIDDAPPLPDFLGKDAAASWADDFGETVEREPLRRPGLLDRLAPRVRRAAGAAAVPRGEDFEIVAEIALEEAVRGGVITLSYDTPVHGPRSVLRAVERSVELRLPRNVTHGQVLRIKGAGGPGANGGPNGDLHVEIAFKRHPLFRVRDHADVWFHLPIAPWEAVLGAEIEIPTLEKPHRVRLPPGVTSGKTLRLAGRGLPKTNGGRGDLLASIRVVTPETPGETERELYLQLARASRFNPRRGLPV